MQQNQHILFKSKTNLGEIGIGIQVFEKISEIALNDLQVSKNIKPKQTFFGYGKSPISVTANDDNVKITVEVNIKYGVNITKTCKEIQERIESLIFQLTDIKDITVDVKVMGVEI